MMRKILCGMVFLLPLGVGIAHAKGLEAVRPLPGYKCMALNLSPKQMMTETVPIRTAPSPSAPKHGIASAAVIASDNPPVNGFQKVLRFDGTPGWVSTKFLKPWVDPSHTGGTCVPSVMSDGLLGFG